MCTKGNSVSLLAYNGGPPWKFHLLPVMMASADRANYFSPTFIVIYDTIYLSRNIRCLLSFLPTDLGAASDSDTALKFLLSHNAHELLLRWLRSEAFARHSKTGIHHFPQFKVDLAKDLKLTIKPIKESICREIAR